MIHDSIQKEGDKKMKKSILFFLLLISIFAILATSANAEIKFHTQGDGVLISEDYKGPIEWQGVSCEPMRFWITGMGNKEGTCSVIVVDGSATVTLNPDSRPEGTITPLSTGTMTIYWSWEEQEEKKGVDEISKAYGYPNPSRNGKAVTFKLVYQHPCRIKIFDQIGQSVWEGISITGELVWPLENDSGQKVVKGIYVYEITDELTGSHKTGKIAVIK